MSRLSCPVSSAILIVCAMQLGCGDAGSLSGSVQGHTIAVRSATFGEYHDTASLTDGENLDVPAVALIISDDPNGCASFKSGALSHESTYVIIEVIQNALVQGSVTQVPEVGEGYYSVQNPGTFDPSKPGGAAAAQFYPPGCNANITAAIDALNVTGYDGGVLIKSIALGSGGSMDADVDIKFGPSAQELQGSIQADYCTSIETMALTAAQQGWTCK